MSIVFLLLRKKNGTASGAALNSEMESMQAAAVPQRGSIVWMAWDPIGENL